MDKMSVMRAGTGVMFDVLELAIDELTVLVRDRKYKGIVVGGVRKMVCDFVTADERREFVKKLYSLKRMRLVEIDKGMNRLVVSLTDKGKRRVLEAAIHERSKKKDGTTYVVYDIPETRRRARDRLRWFLKSVGFKMEQKSVWRIDSDIAAEIMKWIDENKLKKWVNVISENSRT